MTKYGGLGDVDLGSYTLDRSEMGKVLVVASTTLMVVSGHAVLQLSATESKLSDSYDTAEQVSNTVNTRGFNRSLRTLASFQAGTDASRQVRTLLSAASSMRETSSEIAESEQTIEETKEMYQWLVLLSGAGLITGLLERYM